MKKKNMKKKFMNKNFIERIIFSKFGQKRHGWAKICQIVTYFSILPTMTFLFLNVMVHENLSDFQLLWFFTTMTFFFENVILFSKTSWLEKFSGTLNFSRTCHGWTKISWAKISWTWHFYRANSKFCQKRHGWAKICQIVSYFSFLPTMTFFSFNVKQKSC